MLSYSRSRKRISLRATHPQISRRVLRHCFVATVSLLLTLGGAIGVMTRRSHAQEGLVDREAAFAEKADKILKQIRRAHEADRSAIAKGRFRKEESEVEQLSRIAAIESHDSRTTVAVSVTLADDGDAELMKAGFTVESRVGSIATLELDIDRVPDLVSLSSVRKVFASAFRQPLNDRARQAVGIDNTAGQRVVSQTGRGVVVGIIDTGIDFRHLDFTIPGSAGQQTRIKALLDMTAYGSQSPDPNWNYTLPGQTAAIGHLYLESDVNAALQAFKPVDQNSDPIKERDKNGHGTHVAGTAAGNGLSSPTPGTYAGMAPEADLVIVKASRQNDGNDSFRTTDIINAMQFVQQRAAELNEPFVINLSLGGQAGPHDGTNPDERAIDTLVNSGPGRAVCVAAGNEGNLRIHANATIPGGGSQTLYVNVNGAADFIDLYQSHSDRFGVTITRPDGVTLGPVPYGPDSQASDEYLQVFNVNDDKGDTDPANDQPDIFILFKPGAPNGMWKITLQDADGNPNQSYDAWGNGDLYFLDSVDNFHLIASPGNSREAITVGAFITRGVMPIGTAARFTSLGPTADGRRKPEISTPGLYVYSARSTDIIDPNFGRILSGADAPTDSVHYTGLAGTSMATPVTTGAAALFFELNPASTSEQVKEAIKTTSIQDFSYSDPDIPWNAALGYGKLNIAAAMQLGTTSVYTISGHVSQTLGTVAITLSGSQSTVASLDVYGNYRFNNLPAGGTYTITPSIVSGPYQYTFSPPSYTFSNLSANQLASFSSSLVTHKISGHITNPSGKGVSGIEVRANGSAPPALTDDNGYYLISNRAAGLPYHLSAWGPGYVLAPNDQYLETLIKDETVNFTARRWCIISGMVTDQTGSPISSAVVRSTDQFAPFVVTDSNGSFRLYGAREGDNYAVMVSASGYTFTPNGTVIAKVDGDKTVNFVGRRASPTYAISGYVRDASGYGVTGVALQLTGSLTGEALTDSNGSYRFESNNAGGNYSVTPVANGSRFTPATRGITNLSSDVGLDFTLANNPIDASVTFVTQGYRDFLNREPDANGLSFWTNEITSCGANAACVEAKRVNVSAAFFLSIEFQQTGYLVERIYKAAYGDGTGTAIVNGVHFQSSVPIVRFNEFLPDTQKIGQGVIVGQAGWEQQLENNKQTFTTEFVQRARFITALPASMTPAEFVDKLFTNAGVKPSASERADATNEFGSATTSADTTARARALRRMAENSTLTQQEFNRAFVLMQYFGYLRRDPNDGSDTDYSGYDFWLTKLNQFNGNFVNAELVKAFITSAEYRQRFGP